MGIKKFAHVKKTYKTSLNVKTGWINSTTIDTTYIIVQLNIETYKIFVCENLQYI